MPLDELYDVWLQYTSTECSLHKDQTEEEALFLIIEARISKYHIYPASSRKTLGVVKGL